MSVEPKRIDRSPEALKARLEALASEICAEQGLELYEVAVRGSAQQRIFEVSVERDLEIRDGLAHSGVTLDSCATLSRELSARLEPIDALLPPYRLDVSSPGIERELPRDARLAAYLGVYAIAQTADGARHEGWLEAADTQSICLGESAQRLPLEELKSLSTSFPPKRLR